MKLHIGNLPKSMSDTDIKELVTPFGEVTSFEVIRDKTGESRGFGFAEYANADHARAAMSGLDGKDVGGQVLKVGEAKPRKGDAPRPSNTPQA